MTLDLSANLIDPTVQDHAPPTFITIETRFLYTHTHAGHAQGLRSADGPPSHAADPPHNTPPQSSSEY